MEYGDENKQSHSPGRGIIKDERKLHSSATGVFHIFEERYRKIPIQGLHCISNNSSLFRVTQRTGKENRIKERKYSEAYPNLTCYTSVKGKFQGILI